MLIKVSLLSIEGGVNKFIQKCTIYGKAILKLK